jgi:3-hydroxy-3-methylglutaryl CoA synthase
VYGIQGWGTYVPYRRLDRSQIASVTGTHGGSGTRAVAGYDEDSTTMGVEAARRALGHREVAPAAVLFATAAPAYFDKTNATALHAALRLDPEVGAYDAVGSVRSAFGVLSAALSGTAPTLVVTADVRFGLPGSPDESTAGDGAAAVLVGDERTAPVLAEVIARTSLTEEFVDRWREPSRPTSQLWEERFGETRYLPLARQALKSLLERAGLDAGDISALVVAGLHERACAAAAKQSGVAAERIVDRLGSVIGNVGVAQPLLLLASALESARPGDVVVVLGLADGADAIALRVTDALTTYRAAPTIGAQIACGAPISYGRFLTWRGLLAVEPPRRPEPARPSSSAAARNTEWKFGLVGPAGVLAEQRGTVTTSTVDKLAYSPSPPVVFAVVDFDDGTRVPVELTDVDAEEVTIGTRVEMTFRRLFVADGIANYFWKARPVRDDAPRTAEEDAK